MSNITRFAGMYNVNDYAYGCGTLPGTGGQPMPGPLTVGIGTTAGGAGTVTLNYSYTTLPDSTQVFPVTTTTPITIGAGSNAETVTPTAVTNGQINAGQLTCQVTATFGNAHGLGDNISSGTFGLQEAINAASAAGGGEVLVNSQWFGRGGTVAMIQAATVPAGSGSVLIQDLQNLCTWNFTANSVTVVAAPAAAAAGTVASQAGVVGTWTAITIHVLFTYVTANGGESLASSDYSFTATVSVAIGGSGPAAATNAVGYRVYIGANATTTCYLSPVIAANGTVIQCGAIAAFKIGTPFSVATANVAAALAPAQSSAFPAGFVPAASPSTVQPFVTVAGPFAVTGVVTAGSALEAGIVQLPAGFLNRVNRTLRITLQGIYTPVSTATLILSVAVGSVYTGTEVTVYTETSAASSGTTASDWQTQIIIRTAAVGASGTLEAHGYSVLGLVTATAGLGAVMLDTVQAPSSAVDLTKQDYIRFLINSGTANLTQSQLRTAIVEVLQ